MLNGERYIRLLNISVYIIEIVQKIIADHAQSRNVSPEDAKIKFLKIIYQWPTFGSAFFEVKV